MINNVTKADGRLVPFQPNKLNRWAQYASKHSVNWSDLAQKTLRRLTEGCSTADIHQAMIDVCLDEANINHSRVAARLTYATIRKDMHRQLGVSDKHPFEDIYRALLCHKAWKCSIMPAYNPRWQQWYDELYNNRLECWQIKQWIDKYAVKIDNQIVETPHVGALGIGLAIYGDTDEAFNLAKAIITGKANLPTPVVNACRNGDFNTISCCVISAEDSMPSIGTASNIAYEMTARKAGIGIEFTTRSKGDPVKGGRVEHLGKQPIYAMVDKAVKAMTQVSRGGSATLTYKCIDPEIQELLLLKSQRIPENIRLDKLDYSFAYNDAFAEAVLNDTDWYLYSLHSSPEVYEAFHLSSDEYKKVAYRHKPVGSIKARELLKQYLTVRGETGRIYDINLTRTNMHTPFIDTIHLSNLCQEICLPTRGYEGMADLYAPQSKGETAFCSLAAINVSRVDDDEYEELAYLLVKTIDRLITKAGVMTNSMYDQMNKRRSLGIGITGLAGHLYANGMDYEEAHLGHMSYIAERHYYWLLKASQRLVEEGLEPCEGIDLDWLPIDSRVGTHSLHFDWEELRGKPRRNSVLVAHMPTESSAVFSNATNGLYPVRNKVIDKQSRKGRVQYIAPEGNYKLAWDISNIAMSKVYGVFQDFADQGISADYYMVPAKFPGGKVPLSILMKEWIVHYKTGNKTKYYLNINDDNGGVFEEEACDGCKL